MISRAEAKVLNSARSNPILAELLERRRSTEAKLIEALRTSNGSLLLETMNYAEWTPGLLRKLAALSDIPDSSRELVLSLWIRSGDGWRDDVNNDLLLIDVLRNLMPPYRGGEIRLFRGDSVFNRRRRTYGMAWTSDPVVAESFADSRALMYQDGGVLLETFAPPNAIICVPHDHIEDEWHAGEAEYLVDRRRLGEVRVVKRYPGCDSLAARIRAEAARRVSD
jgi:hypothetical protein